MPKPILRLLLPYATVCCVYILSPSANAGCSIGENTAECLESDLKIQEKVLEQQLEQRLSSTSEEERASLESTQTLWEKFRNSACQTEAKNANLTSIVAKAKAELACLVRMTRHRAQELGAAVASEPTEVVVKPNPAVIQPPPVVAPSIEALSEAPIVSIPPQQSVASPNIASLIEDGEEIGNLKDFMSEVDSLRSMDKSQSERQWLIAQGLIQWLETTVEEINQKHGKELFKMPSLDISALAFESHSRCKAVENTLCVGIDKELKLNKLKGSVVFFGPKSFVKHAENSIIIAQEKVKVSFAKNSLIVAEDHITLTNSDQSLVLTPGSTTAMAVRNSVIYAGTGVLPDMRSAIHCLNTDKVLNAAGHCYEVNIKSLKL